MAANRRLKVLFSRMSIDRKCIVELETQPGLVVVVSLNTYTQCFVAKKLSRFHRPRFCSGPRRDLRADATQKVNGDLNGKQKQTRTLRVSQ